jgi:hypothetical protein
MTKNFLAFSMAIIMGFAASAQMIETNDPYRIKRNPEPFLFSKSTLTPEDLKWSMDYSTSYGERVKGAFGFDGVGQQFGLKGYLGRQFTLYVHGGFGFTRENEVSSAQQAEIIHDFIGGKKNQGFRLGIGLGASRDFSNVGSVLSRVTVAYDTPRWKACGNILFQKAFAANRDNIDVISSVGFHRLLFGKLYGGFEAVGEDLEGFWDKEEAEGGAKLLVGPSLNMTTNNQKIAFSVSGGPVFYATSNQISNLEALRELPTQAGLTLRARIAFNLTQ